MQNIGNSSRRDFLLAAGLGAAAAVTVAGAASRNAGIADSAAPKNSRGYRASPHVMKYYQTTEV